MKETETRRLEIFDDYLCLAREDMVTYYRQADVEISDCPACRKTCSLAFVKHEFSYEVCPNFHFLFVNLRQVEAAFLKCHSEPPASKYWFSTFHKETTEVKYDLFTKDLFVVESVLA